VVYPNSFLFTNSSSISATAKFVKNPSRTWSVVTYNVGWALEVRHFRQVTLTVEFAGVFVLPSQTTQTVKTESGNSVTALICEPNGELSKAADRTWYGALGISTIIHVCVIGIIGLWTIAENDSFSSMGVDTAWNESSDDTVDETRVETVEISRERTVRQSAGSLVSTALLPQPTKVPELFTLPDDGLFAALVSDQLQGALNLNQHVTVNDANLPGNGNGNSEGNGEDKTNGFFGTGTTGKSFVFVVDCSLSMNHPHASEAKTRFRRLKVELVKTITRMNAENRFFIIFFNETAIPMPARSLQFATASRQKQYLYWMQKVRAIGDTDPRPALRMALKLRPDVIYFLTDGVFELPIQRDLLKMKKTKATIHTFSFSHPVTSTMQQAIEFLKNKQPTRARRLCRGNEYDICRTLVRSEALLKEVADRTGGKYYLIP